MLVKLIIMILYRFKLDVNKRVWYGNTPLLTALTSGQSEEIVQFLIEMDAGRS